MKVAVSSFFDINATDKLITKPLTKHLLVWFSLVMLLVAAGSSYLMYREHVHHLHDLMELRLKGLMQTKENLIVQQVEGLSLAIKPIASNPATVQALKEQNRHKLLALWLDIFGKMKAENSLTHFYFLNKDRVCILRVHNPGRYGDRIDRFTAEEAEWSRKISSGIEIGPMGTLTLRVVQPVIVENEIIGYIELGKEIEDILSVMHSDNDTQIALLLHKSVLNQNLWKEGMQMLGRENDWNILDRDVLAYSSLVKLPKAFLADLSAMPLADNEQLLPARQFDFNGNIYNVALTSMKDVGGKEVGRLVVLNNMTKENLEFENMIFTAGSVLLVLMGALFGLVYFLLNRADNAIRKQHQNLVENRFRFEQFARHSRTIIWEVDENGRYTYVNDVVFDVLGYHANEVLGLSFDTFHPALGEHYTKNLFESSNPVSNLKNCSFSKDGREVWLMTNALPVISPSGKLIGYRGSDMDITEWKKTEEDMDTSRSLLKTIIDTIPIRVFWKNRQLRYMGCNTLFAKDAGYVSAEEIIGKDDYQMGWATEADMYRDDDRHTIISGSGKLFYEEEQTTPTGDKIWLSTSKMPLRDAEGEIVGVVGMYEDITVRKQFEEKLRLSEQKLKEAQRFARMGSWSLDLKDNRLEWSDEVFEIFEITDREFGASYKAFLETIHPDDREMVNGVYLDSVKTKERYEVTHRLLMKDGRIKWIQEMGMSEYDSDGNPVRSIGTVQDITERKTADEMINTLAFYDTLTGLANRTLLLDRLKQTMVLSQKNGEYGALVFIDLDHFKAINDTRGHNIGDILLKQTGERIQALIGEKGSAARLGGDDFAVLMSGLGKEEEAAAIAVEEMAERIREAISLPFELETGRVHSTASIGITLFARNDGNADNVMKQADLAMYRSKDAGRHTISFFDPKMEASLNARTVLENEMRKGIEHEEFTLHYQPQCDWAGKVKGVEALVRWNHPILGQVSPGEFIPIAEESGLILPLGKYILLKACSQSALWHERFPDSAIKMAVNISVRQFSAPDFVEEVQWVIEQTRIDPSRLELELTESLMVENIEEVIAKMTRLKEMGVSFSLDDFGTGYSSLSYLKRLPFDVLKIDQSFVRDILVDENDAMICKSTIVLAESMGLSVIAEGVETLDQRNRLEAFGCKCYQGYLLSRPLPADEFETFLTNCRRGEHE